MIISFNKLTINYTKIYYNKIFLFSFSNKSLNKFNNSLVLINTNSSHSNKNHKSFKDFKDNKFLNLDIENYIKDNKLVFLKYDLNGNPKLGFTYYDYLGVSNKASLKEIRFNYLLIVKLYHPDIRPDLLVR